MSSKRFAAPNASDTRHQAPASRARQAQTPERTATTKSAAQLTNAAPRSQTTRTPHSAPPLPAPEEARKPMTFEDEMRGKNDFKSLGELLVYLRDTYGERTGYTAQGPAFDITALAVAEKLSQYGYHMTSGSYSQLEHGLTLPKNPERFFEAICAVLAIDKQSKYWVLLRYQYLYDQARRTVGDEFASTYCPRGQRVLDLLKKGEF